jgi:hypothetical protein
MSYNIVNDLSAAIISHEKGANMTDSFYDYPSFYRENFFIQYVNLKKVNQIIPLIMKKNNRVFKSIFIFLYS